jgi:serine/threonine protein kinase
MPLGSSPHASTYLVRDERLAGSIYRLKRWNTQAPPEFLPRFEDLRRRLAERPVAGALRPVAAYVDGRGHPVVLSPFVQGIPIIEAVAAGTLDVPQALELMRTASAVLRAAHDSDLVHGSITAGNVVAYARTGAVHLLDFGISSLWHANVPDAAGFAEDRHRLAALIRTLRGPRRRGGAQAPL